MENVFLIGRDVSLNVPDLECVGSSGIFVLGRDISVNVPVLGLDSSVKVPVLDLDSSDRSVIVLDLDRFACPVNEFVRDLFISVPNEFVLVLDISTDSVLDLDRDGLLNAIECPTEVEWSDKMVSVLCLEYSDINVGGSTIGDLISFAS
jgi:hypothetical protein